MTIETIHLVYFSPTGTTRRIVAAISLSSTPIAERMVMLNQNCSERREPELFV